MVFDLLITFFLFAITVVMLAGTGSLLQQWLGLPKPGAACWPPSPPC